MKVICFGASVTQQYMNNKSGVITGYFHSLKRFIKREGSDISVERICAGSSSFDDAGYGLLPSVLIERPDVVVFEWHTAQFKEFKPVLWKSFLSTIRDHKIHLIIAIFPNKSSFESGSMPENITRPSK